MFSLPQCQVSFASTGELSAPLSEPRALVRACKAEWQHEARQPKIESLVKGSPLSDASGHVRPMADTAGQGGTSPIPPTGAVPPPLMPSHNPHGQPPTANSAVASHALAAVSGNVGAAADLSGVTQRGALPRDSKPRFMMKRTGHATLPHDTPTRDRSSSSTPTPLSSHGTSTEPEPAQIVSDLLLSQPPSAPILGSSPAPSQSNSTSDGTRKAKYATDEERRKATSLALKRT